MFGTVITAFTVTAEVDCSSAYFVRTRIDKNETSTLKNRHNDSNPSAIFGIKNLGYLFSSSAPLGRSMLLADGAARSGLERSYLKLRTRRKLTVKTLYGDGFYVLLRS